MTEKMNTMIEEYSRFLDSSGRHMTYAVLSVYRNAPEEMSEKERTFVREHLRRCEQCAERMKEVDEVESEPVRRGVLPGRFRYAVAATLVIAAGTALFFLFKPERPETGAGDAPIAAVVKDDARFAPNPMLEAGIERTFRSPSTISMSAPGLGDTVAVPFAVQWKGTAKNELTSVTVVDNRNTAVWNAATRSSSVTVDRPLEPGLYYIKVSAGERPAHIGKIFVR